MNKVKGKIAVLIEDHFDSEEFMQFNRFFPEHGYVVEYVTHLWNQPGLTFYANPDDGFKIRANVTVTTEVGTVRPSDYRGILLIGAYAMDRLRYEAKTGKGKKNQAPAVKFIRQAMRENVPVGTICHSLWLLCADPDLIRGRKVTCAHNIICDVENAGAEVVYNGDETAATVADGNLISGKHPGVLGEFLELYLNELNKRSA